MSPHASALGIPVYRRYLAARTVALAGNALTLVALPVLAYRLSGSAALTALTAAAGTAPYLLLGLLAGAVADRRHRRRLVVACGLASAAALATVPLADAVGALAYPHLLVVALAVGSLFVFADAAAFGIVPQMVGRDRVASATSTLVTVGTAISVVGPVAAGALVAVLPASWVIGLDALAHLIAALLVSRLRWPGSEAGGTSRGATPGGERAASRVRADIAEGVRCLWQHPVVRSLTLIGVGCSLAGGAVSGLIVVLGVESLGMDAEGAGIGWLFGAAASGTFVASLCLPRLQGRLGVGVITSAGFAVAALAAAGLAATTRTPVALACLAGFHLATTTIIVNGIVVRQVVTPAPLQARVNTTARMIAWGGSPIGAAGGGLIASFAGVAWAIGAASAVLLGSLAIAALSGVPRYPRLALLERPDERAEERAGRA